MKKTLLTTATIISCAAFILSNAAFAATAADTKKAPQNYAYFGIHGSQHYFDMGGQVPNPDFDDSFIPGLQLGYQINKNWSLQGWWEKADMQREASPLEEKISAYYFSARHHYHGNSLLGFEPYTGAALGDKKIGNKNETIGAFEMGLQRYLGQRFLLELGARPSYSFDNERWDGQLYAAINFAFWRTAKIHHESNDEDGKSGATSNY